MLKSFSIDFIRQIFEQKLLEEHIKDVNLFGGKDQVNIFSFYEQLKTQDEIDRFVENYRDLADQQNRSGLILNGVIVAPENPTITNLYSCDIIPMSWTCSMRATLENRDQAQKTINNLIKVLKGRKVDIAELDLGKGTYVPFMVGTIGQNEDEPSLKDGDYIGAAYNKTLAKSIIDDLISKDVNFNKDKEYKLYSQMENESLGVIKLLYNGRGETLPIVGDSVTFEIEDNQVIVTAQIYVDLQGQQPPLIDEINADVLLSGGGEFAEYKSVVGLPVDSEPGDTYYIYTVNFVVDMPEFTPTNADIDNANVYVQNVQVDILQDSDDNEDFIFPPTNYGFEKYKCSLSFDAIRCDEPRNLNAREYCELSFGGSATLVNESVQLGNDLIKIGIKKLKIPTENNDIDFTTLPHNPTWWLEPLEMPSGLNANTNPIQLASNMLKTNSHTDAVALSLQYTFICDKSVPLLKQLFKYGRYGTQGLTIDDISPNMIFGIKEIWSSWGDYDPQDVKAKLVENVDIENTESDTLTLMLSLQIQGDNE